MERTPERCIGPHFSEVEAAKLSKVELPVASGASGRADVKASVSAKVTMRGVIVSRVCRGGSARAPTREAGRGTFRALSGRPPFAKIKKISISVMESLWAAG